MKWALGGAADAAIEELKPGKKSQAWLKPRSSTFTPKQ
jgi:hypothetical protein